MRHLLKFREAEAQSPRWYKDACDVWNLDEDTFLGFCEQCYRIYELGDAIIYCEKTSDTTVEIHFSILRGGKIDVDDLKTLRDELLKEFDMVFGWVVNRNYAVKRICEKVGLRHYGVTMLHGSTHGKPIEWQAYSINKLQLNKNI